ncbi:hypothetical protein EVAR_89486_1 [Eumeta japonica]|uniref:Histone-lysine N-methyltransferase SETMAR n=1 Tax=Eumeta variegata TaxID=151549 RepID=A0A4C1XLP8_EUMVA|nr:hypothetical protein EVAR_89486_1 [Eumeta japonica]
MRGLTFTGPEEAVIAFNQHVKNMLPDQCLSVGRIRVSHVFEYAARPYDARLPGTTLAISRSLAEHLVERVAEALDIGRNTVSRITREKIGQEGMSENKLSTPNKKRTKVKPITDLDNFGKDAIRNHIYDYYRRMELSTLLKLLKSLKEADLFKGEPMTIIINNAPYHSVQVNKPPNQSNRKSELVKWLSENGVTADITMLKTELIALVRRHKPPTPTYALDEMAKKRPPGPSTTTLPLPV